MANSSSTIVKRMLKCFCGCTELTEEEVERIYQLSTLGTLTDSQANLMFHKFLDSERTGDDNTIAEQHLQVYEACKDYIQEDRMLTSTDLKKLKILGLIYRFQKQLKNNIKHHNVEGIQNSLQDIQTECLNEIESTDEFKRFKQAIKDKLNNIQLN